jgi:predicted ester cyclase
MTNESIKQVARELAAAHARGDVQAVRELLSPRLVWRMAGVPKTMGRDDYLEGMQTGQQAFSEMSIHIEDEVAEGDKVAQRWTIRVRHTGPFQSIPATNRAITFTTVWFYKIVERTIVEASSIDQDFTGMLR